MISLNNYKFHSPRSYHSICFQVVCPDGFLEHAQNCYKVSSDRLSWHEARFECLGLEGNYDLAVVKNEELFEFLKSYSHHWIGLYSRVGTTNFRWVDNTNAELETWEQTPWGASEPSVRLVNYTFILCFDYKYKG